MSDLISRQTAITIPVMPKEDREYQTYNLDDAYEQAWEDLQKIIEQLPSANAISIEWLESFTNNYCDLAAAIDTQFFINEFILKRWRAESEGKDWSQIKNNEEKNYQYIKKLLREGKASEADKFVEEKENETN